MRISLATAVRTLSSLDPVITPAASATSVQAPSQTTRDTFVAGDTSSVPVKSGLAPPAHMETAAGRGKETYLAVAPRAEAAAAGALGCTDLNDTRTECIPRGPKTTRSPFVPTGPPKKTDHLTTETATSVITVRPTTTHIRTATSIDTSFETVTVTVMGDNPAYIAAMRFKAASSTLKITPRDDKRVHARGDPVPPGDFPGQDLPHLAGDQLYESVVEDTDSATGSLRQSLTPKERQRVETKLRFDKGLLEAFDNDQVELINFIAHEWFQGQIKAAIEEAEDMAQLEKRLKWIIQHGHIYEKGVPGEEGEPEYTSAPNRDRTKKQQPRDVNKRSPNAFETAIRAISNVITGGTEHLWEMMHAIVGRTPQKGPLEDVKNDERVMVTRSRPFLSPKQARKLCMSKCSAKREPCAC